GTGSAARPRPATHRPRRQTYSASGGGNSDSDYGGPASSVRQPSALHRPTQTSYPGEGPGRRTAPGGSGGAVPVFGLLTHPELDTISTLPEAPRQPGPH